VRKPCLTQGCPQYALKGSRCPDHSRAERQRLEAQRTSRGQATYDGEYRRNRDILLANSPRCTYCPRPATTADHRIALRLGGSNDLTTLVPSCARCNSSRGASLGHSLGGRGKSWR